MTTVVHVSQPHDVCVMRPGKWGNPFKVGIHGTRRQVVEKHRVWLPQRKGLMEDLRELRGKRIACCCKGQPCHAYTLAEEADKSGRDGETRFPIAGLIGMVNADGIKVTILLKNNLTDKQIPVNLSSPARNGHNNPNNHANMNPKFALIAGILATAFTQIKNVFTGGDDEPAPKPGKPAKATKAAPVVEEEPVEDDDTEITMGGEAADDVDYDALRKEANKLVRKMFTDTPEKKPKVFALIKAAGAANITTMDDDKIEAFVAAVKKIK